MDILFNEVNATENVSNSDPAEEKIARKVLRKNSINGFALRALVRYGSCKKSYDVFMKHVEASVLSLSEKEIAIVWNDAVRFFNGIVSGRADCGSPEEREKLFGLQPLKPDDYSDLGEAKVVARELSDELLFVTGIGWMRYNGKVWVENKEYAIGGIENFLDIQLADAKQNLEDIKMRLLNAGVPKSLLRKMNASIRNFLPENEKYLADAFESAHAYLKFVSKRRDYSKITATGNAAAPILQRDVSELDKYWSLINTPDGTYDIRKGPEGKQEHSPDDYLTKITACSPGDKGKKLWLEAVNMFFSGDRELIDYVQMAVGTAAIGKVFLEQLIIAYGNGGNGKSTFFNAIYRVMGTYACKLASDVLTTSTRRNTMPAKAELKGKRLVIASETEEGMRLNMGVIKQLCSTDEISAEKKFKDPFEFVPSHTLVLYTNHLPKVGTHDDGTWRRVVVIPFNAKLTGKGDIKNYSDYLVENAGPYILAWVLEGARKAIEKKFIFEFPDTVKNAIAEYMAENDWFSHYLEDNCDVSPEYFEKSGALYQNYRAYCFSNGEYARSTTDFYKTLEQAGFKRKKTSRGIIVSGLRLKIECPFDEINNNTWKKI